MPKVFRHIFLLPLFALYVLLSLQQIVGWYRYHPSSDVNINFTDSLHDLYF